MICSPGSFGAGGGTCSDCGGGGGGILIDGTGPSGGASGKGEGFGGGAGGNSYPGNDGVIIFDFI